MHLDANYENWGGIEKRGHPPPTTMLPTMLPLTYWPSCFAITFCTAR